MHKGFWIFIRIKTQKPLYIKTTTAKAFNRILSTFDGINAMKTHNKF